jgi:plastocyanin
MRACGWILPVAALLVAGCGSSSSSGTTTTTPVASAPGDSGGIVQIVMVSLDFSPTAVHARVGQQVLWKNEDSSPHNVTYVSGPKTRSSRPIMPPGATFSIRLTEPGTIHYYCTIHPWMKATIVVSQ